MNTTNLPEFLTSAAFWFSLVNAIIMFLPRFGITLSQQEIAAVNLVLGSIFKVAPPLNGYISAKRYEIKARSTPIKLEE